MPIYDLSGNLKVAGDRAGNIEILNSSGSSISTTATFIQFSGSAVTNVRVTGSGVLVTLEAGSGSTSTGSSGGSGSFTKGAMWSYPLTIQDRVIWRCENAHTLTRIRGFLSGATGATASFQAYKNSTNPHLSATLHLNSNNFWFDGGTVATTSYVAGDYLQFRLLSLSGTVVFATVQADFAN